MELDGLPKQSDGAILVVTGGREVGKTTFCRKVIGYYRGEGKSVSGLLSPARFENGKKTGILAVALETNEQRLLASQVEGEIDGVRQGCWTFDAEVVAWGNQQLEKIVETNLLVIDELGPLEFQRHLGWQAAFDCLKFGKFGLALVVIRPECLGDFSGLGFTFEVKKLSHQ
ncbi:MAG TPA: nucleoside-triphosphatase [Longilinea sp.]|nr:nucleoside-triphosphatase [Longilinea sp.]